MAQVAFEEDSDDSSDVALLPLPKEIEVKFLFEPEDIVTVTYEPVSRAFSLRSCVMSHARLQYRG